MIDDNDTQYPDSEPLAMGDLKAIKRHPNMQSPAPKIRWGKKYDAMPIGRRLDRAEKVANAMNHAADVLQTERNKLIEVCKAQEAQLVAAKAEQTIAQELLQTEMDRHNAEKQELYQQVAVLQKDTKAQAKHIAKLERS